MKTQISFHNIEQVSHESLEKIIHELSKRHIEKYLARFDSDTVELHVHLERSNRRAYYQVRAQLMVPGATLTSREEGWDVVPALRKAFDELERELLQHKERLRQDAAWRRKERGAELQRLKKAVEDNPSSGATFGDLVKLLLPQLQRYVQREVSALRASGELDPSYPTPQDIVDEVLVRAYQRHDHRPTNVDPLHWLYQITHEVLNDEVQQHRREGGRFESAESRSPVPRDYTVDELDQGVFEFWQPDEMLKLERVTPVQKRTPEDEASEEEMRKYLHDAFAKLPANWRRAMWLMQAEGIPVSKVAHMMGTSEDEVKRWIEQADAFLRAKLKEAGYEPAEVDQLPFYFFPTPATATPELAEALDDVTRGGK
jgi:ribosomal subunit interface protein